MRCKKLREIPNAASTKFSWDPATPVCAPAVNSFFPSSGALSSVTHKAKNTPSSYSVLTPGLYHQFWKAWGVESQHLADLTVGDFNCALAGLRYKSPLRNVSNCFQSQRSSRALESLLPFCRWSSLLMLWGSPDGVTGLMVCWDMS